MVTVISWFSFWIEPTGLNSPIRFIIVLVCVFYSSAYSAWLNAGRFPQVDYTKMVDIWTGVSIVPII